MATKKIYLKDLKKEEIPKFLRHRYKNKIEEDYTTSSSFDAPSFDSDGIEDKIEPEYLESKPYDDPVKEELKDASEIQGDYEKEIDETILEKCSPEEYKKVTSRSLTLAGYSEDKVDDLIRTEFETMSPRVKMLKLRNLLETKLKEYEEEGNKDKYEATKMVIDITRTLYPEVE